MGLVRKIGVYVGLYAPEIVLAGCLGYFDGKTPYSDSTFWLDVTAEMGILAVIPLLKGTAHYGKRKEQIEKGIPKPSKEVLDFERRKAQLDGIRVGAQSGLASMTSYFVGKELASIF